MALFQLSVCRVGRHLLLLSVKPVLYPSSQRLLLISSTFVGIGPPFLVAPSPSLSGPVLLSNLPWSCTSSVRVFLFSFC